MVSVVETAAAPHSHRCPAKGTREPRSRLHSPGSESPPPARVHGIARLFSEPAGDKSLIQRYVFPDGELPPIADVVGAFQAAGLEARDVESLREHYALTLRRWLGNLHADRAAMAADAGEERTRVWELYMAGSALAFEDADISVFQVLAARPGAPHGLPLLREAAFAPADERRPGRALSAERPGRQAGRTASASSSVTEWPPMRSSRSGRAYASGSATTSMRFSMSRS